MFIGYCRAATADDIYEMYYSNGYSVEEIARRLNVSVEYVEDVIGYGVE